MLGRWQPKTPPPPPPPTEGSGCTSPDARSLSKGGLRNGREARTRYDHPAKGFLFLPFKGSQAFGLIETPPACKISFVKLGVVFRRVRLLFGLFPGCHFPRRGKHVSPLEKDDLTPPPPVSRSLCRRREREGGSERPRQPRDSLTFLPRALGGAMLYKRRFAVHPLWPGRVTAVLDLYILFCYVAWSPNTFS